MIFPAIDLMDGGCVRLYKGDFNQRTDYEATPMDVAKSYAAAGAEWMHVKLSKPSLSCKSLKRVV